jgi:hypothetical protein
MDSVATASEVEQDGMRIEIRNKHPIELADLTRSFQAFAAEYRDHIEMVGDVAEQDDVRLYITKLESGSIIAEVVAMAPPFAPLMPIVAQTYKLASYGVHLRKIIDYLLGKSEDGSEVSKTSIEHSIAIVDPIAKDRGSQLNIGTVNGNVYVNMSSHDANALQGTARRLLDEMEAPSMGRHNSVVLYFHQARNETTNSAGDKAIIEQISTRPVRTKFANENLKREMVFKQENPFLEAYLVDVVVQTVRGAPKLYTIETLHEVMPREDGTVGA